MVKRNTIFLRILIPLLIVMTFQTLLIGLVLFANGTIRSIEENAVETLVKNAENRGGTLENLMVYNYSGIDRLEGEITVKISAYLAQNGISADEFVNGCEHQNRLLYDVSDVLLTLC